MDDRELTPEYETDQLNFAATLLCEGKQFKRVIPHPHKPRLSIFIFADDGTLEGLNQDYLHHKMRVEPMRFNENIRWLKNWIMENPNAA